MKDLTTFIENRLAMCRRSTDRRAQENFYAQAFGALDFYNGTHPELWPQLEKLWAEYRPRFERIIYKTP